MDRNGNLLVALGSSLITISPRSGRVASFPWNPPAWQNPPPGASRNPDITGVAADSHGQIYLTVGEMHLLQRLAPSGRVQATWGDRASDIFRGPHGIAVDRSGVMYLADTGDGAIKKLAPSGETVATWNAAGYPQGVALDREGNVYVTSVKGDTSALQVFSPHGAVLRQWPLPGRAGEALGSNPVSVAVDDAGDVYVAELDALRVEKFSPRGEVLAVWQAPPDAQPVDYLHPTALTLDTRGDLWVGYSLPDRIVAYSPQGSELTSWPIPPLSSALVSDPADALAFDPSGHLWVGAYEEVMEMSSTGQVMRSWSTWGTTPGAFIAPAGIASDATGAIYVADRWNNWVQKLTPPAARRDGARR